MGRLRESLIGYRMVTKLDPINHEAWLDYGETLFELGYFKQALKAYDQSITANPNFSDSYYCRTKVLLVLNRTFEALESLKHSFQLHPDKRKDFENSPVSCRSI
jgi:tetratricopeptide (TPR) repeat protein